jgi:hypothetical protein
LNQNKEHAMESLVITNKHDATMSVRAINDVINTKNWLAELRIIDGLPEKKQRQEYLQGKLSMMWDGDKYNEEMRDK